jgi:hypothetical protein
MHSLQTNSVCTDDAGGADHANSVILAITVIVNGFLGVVFSMPLVLTPR